MNVEFITLRCGESKVLLNWLFDLLLNCKMTHSRHTMVRDVLWILISNRLWESSFYPCKWLWRISYLHKADMGRGVFWPVLMCKITAFQMSCVVSSQPCWGKKKVVCCSEMVEQWIFNSSLIPEFGLNLN